jgi:hypothetical protein
MSDAAPKAAVSKGAAETAQSLRLLRSLTRRQKERLHNDEEDNQPKYDRDTIEREIIHHLPAISKWTGFILRFRMIKEALIALSVGLVQTGSGRGG